MVQREQANRLLERCRQPDYRYRRMGYAGVRCGGQHDPGPAAGAGVLLLCGALARVRRLEPPRQGVPGLQRWESGDIHLNCLDPVRYRALR